MCAYNCYAVNKDDLCKCVQDDISSANCSGCVLLGELAIISIHAQFSHWDQCLGEEIIHSSFNPSTPTSYRHQEVKLIFFMIQERYIVKRET